MSDNIYSPNFLKNSSCENHNLLEWDYQNVVAKTGGQGGTWMFEFSPTGHMEQSVLAATIDGTPPNFRITAAFKLPQVQDPIDTSVKAYITLSVEYKDDTFDVFVIPCIDNVKYADNLQNGWVFTQQDCIVKNKQLEVVKVRIDTENITGGLQLDYITLQKDTGVDQYSSEAINSQLPSLLYYTNPSQITVVNAETQPVYLGITAVQSSNLSVSLVIYGTSAEVCTLTITLQLDSTNIPFTPLKQKVQVGDFIIGIPFTIPQVAQGAHYFGVKLQANLGTVTIQPNMLQVTVDGRYLSGGLSPDLPHAEVQWEIHYIDVSSGRLNSDCIVLTDLPISRTIWDYITWFDINNDNHCRIGNVTAALTQTAEESYFLSTETDDWLRDLTYTLMNGLLLQKTVFDSNMTVTELGSGFVFTGQMLESTHLTSISKLEVE